MTMTALPRIELGRCERLLVVSDVHLRHPADELSQVFFKALEGLSGPGVLVFLGDIFDFIYADSRYFLKRWKRFFDACEGMRARGLKVVFVEGNHDFGFKPKEMLARYFDASGDVEVIATHSTCGKIILRHGDDVICKPGYRSFRKLVKSNAVERVLTKAPHAMIDWACLHWAQVSRGRHENYKLDRSFIETCMMELTAGERTFYADVQAFVFGHIHVDANFSLASGARFVSGPDWVNCPSVLTLEGGKFLRKYLSAPPRPEQVLVIHDKSEPSA